MYRLIACLQNLCFLNFDFGRRVGGSVGLQPPPPSPWVRPCTVLKIWRWGGLVGLVSLMAVTVGVLIDKYLLKKNMNKTGGLEG